MKDFAIIADSIKTPVLEVHPYRAEFTANSKTIIDNMFQQHTARRYLQGSVQKFKTIAPTHLAPIALTFSFLPFPMPSVPFFPIEGFTPKIHYPNTYE